MTSGQEASTRSSNRPWRTVRASLRERKALLPGVW